MLSNQIKGLKVNQHLVGGFTVLSVSYKVNDVLHPLLQARHAQLPYFELHSFLFEHLTGQAHGRHGVLALGRLLQKLLMKLLQVAYCQRGGIRPLFEIYYMLCHVVEPNKSMMIIVLFCRCRKCKVEGGLETRVMAHISRIGLRRSSL